MRGWVGVAMLLGAVLVLFSGNAAAHPSVLDITVDDGDQEARFNEEACLPLCPVGSTEVGYLAPVTIVASGGTVSWEATDNVYHLNREYNAQGPANPPDSCISVAIWPGDVGTATFEIRPDGLWAQDPGDEFAPCPRAESLPEGSYVLPYFCAAHGAPQNGFLLVTPPGA